MKQDSINRDLREHDNEGSKFQSKILKLVKQYITVSSDMMYRYQESFDNNDLIYRGYRMLDRNDRDAVKDNEPPKIIVPITYAQIQTAISFIYSTFSQREFIYELQGRGPEDTKNAATLNIDLGYQTTYNKFMLKLYLYLLDVMKYGFGVMKVDWDERNCKLRTQKKVPITNIFNRVASMFGRPAEEKYEIMEEVIEVLEYQGNFITNISPFCFYPDPSCTLANFQDGKFVAHDEETSMTTVRKLEGKTYHGTDKIPATLPTDDQRERRRRSGRAWGDETLNRSVVPGADSKASRVDVCVKTEYVIQITPKDFSEEFKDTGLDFGTENYPTKWLVVVGNDQKLIRFEPLGYLHDQFPYVIGEYSPDANSFFNPGLADTIYELQNITTFLLNSHVVNIRKIIQNRFVVDPASVFTEDITNNAMMIRLKKAGLPLDRVIKQLESYDVTKGNVQDIGFLMSMIQTVTGINENALGQYSQGRRSATEARSVNAGSAARLKMHAQLIWQQGLDPLGRMMLSNTRQGRSQEVFDMIVGTRALQTPFDQVILASPNKIAGGYDFVPYDATLPSDKQFQAGMLQELMTTLIQNPESAAMLNKDPVKLLNHIADLYGINNLNDYDLNPAQPLVSPQAQVVPDDQAREAAAGGAQPVDVLGENLIRSLSQQQPTA